MEFPMYSDWYPLINKRNEVTDRWIRNFSKWEPQSRECAALWLKTDITWLEMCEKWDYYTEADKWLLYRLSSNVYIYWNAIMNYLDDTYGMDIIRLTGNNINALNANVYLQNNNRQISRYIREITRRLLQIKNINTKVSGGT